MNFSGVRMLLPGQVLGLRSNKTLTGIRSNHSFPQMIKLVTGSKVIKNMRYPDFG